MFDYGVCFGGMLRGYASGYASHSVKTKVVAFPEGMLRGYASGYASPKSNIPALHKLDTLKKDKPIHMRMVVHICFVACYCHSAPQCTSDGSSTRVLQKNVG